MQPYWHWSLAPSKLQSGMLNNGECIIGFFSRVPSSFRQPLVITSILLYNKEDWFLGPLPWRYRAVSCPVSTSDFRFMAPDPDLSVYSRRQLPVSHDEWTPALPRRGRRLLGGTCLNCTDHFRSVRPREAPDDWCPENRPKSPSNAQIFPPQIHKFGHRLPRDVLKW